MRETEDSGLVRVHRRRAGWFRRKAAIDLAVAYLLLVPTGAVIAVLALLVRATSRGPGLYRQIRVGKDGRHFTIYKIRTMRFDAEAASGPVWTQPHDPRMTFLGPLLRKLHLDELPQIFNVLRGEMSFVGPRPERPEFVRLLSKAVPGYHRRLAVRPGITGLAQVNLPPDSDLQSVRRKLVLDYEYVRSAGPWLDLRLFVCAAARLLRVSLVRLLAFIAPSSFRIPRVPPPTLTRSSAVPRRRMCRTSTPLATRSPHATPGPVRCSPARRKGATK